MENMINYPGITEVDALSLLAIAGNKDWRMISPTNTIEVDGFHIEEYDASRRVLANTKANMIWVMHNHIAQQGENVAKFWEDWDINISIVDESVHTPIINYIPKVEVNTASYKGVTVEFSLTPKSDTANSLYGRLLFNDLGQMNRVIYRNDGYDSPVTMTVEMRRFYTELMLSTSVIDALEVLVNDSSCSVSKDNVMNILVQAAQLRNEVDRRFDTNVVAIPVSSPIDGQTLTFILTDESTSTEVVKFAGWIGRDFQTKEVSPVIGINSCDNSIDQLERIEQFIDGYNGCDENASIAERVLRDINSGKTVVIGNKDFIKSIDEGIEANKKAVKELKDKLLQSESFEFIRFPVNVVSGVSDNTFTVSRGNMMGMPVASQSLLEWDDRGIVNSVYNSNVTAFMPVNDTDELTVRVSRSEYNRNRSKYSRFMFVGRNPVPGKTVMAKVVIVADEDALGDISFDYRIMEYLGGDFDGDGLRLYKVQFSTPKKFVSKEYENTEMTILSDQCMDTSNESRTPANFYKFKAWAEHSNLNLDPSSKIENALVEAAAIKQEISYMKALFDSTVSSELEIARFEAEVETLWLEYNHLVKLGKHSNNVPAMSREEYTRNMCIYLDDNGFGIARSYSNVTSTLKRMWDSKSEVYTYKDIYVDLKKSTFDNASINGTPFAELTKSEQISEVYKLFIGLNSNEDGEMTDRFKVEFNDEWEAITSEYSGEVLEDLQLYMIHHYAGTACVGIFANNDFNRNQFVSYENGLGTYGTVLDPDSLGQEVAIQMQKKFQDLGNLRAMLLYVNAVRFNEFQSKEVESIKKNIGLLNGSTDAIVRAKAQSEIDGLQNRILTNNIQVKWSDLKVVPTVLTTMEHGNLSLRYINENEKSIQNDLVKLIDVSLPIGESWANLIVKKDGVKYSKALAGRILEAVSEVFKYTTDLDENNNIIAGGVAPGYHTSMLAQILVLYTLESATEVNTWISKQTNSLKRERMLGAIAVLNREFILNGDKLDMNEFVMTDEQLVEIKRVIGLICAIAGTQKYMVMLWSTVGYIHDLGEWLEGVSNWKHQYFKIPFVGVMRDVHLLEIGARHGIEYIETQDVVESLIDAYHACDSVDEKDILVATREEIRDLVKIREMKIDEIDCIDNVGLTTRVKARDEHGNVLVNQETGKAIYITVPGIVRRDADGNVVLSMTEHKELCFRVQSGVLALSENKSREEYSVILDTCKEFKRNLSMLMINRYVSGIESDFISDNMQLETFQPVAIPSATYSETGDFLWYNCAVYEEIGGEDMWW